MSHPTCSVCLARSGAFITEDGHDGERVVCRDAIECCARRLALLQINEGEINLAEFLTIHPSCEGFEGYRTIHGHVFNDHGHVLSVPRST